MASISTRGSMGLVQRDEGRTALVASKLTAITYRWISLDKGTLTGMHNSLPTAASRGLFLPFPLVWGFFFLNVASQSMVRTLAKPIALACPVEALSKALVDRCFWLPSATNAAPPAPYLANSLSSPYFKYANIWMYRTRRSLSWIVSRWAISSPPRMVT